jgi:predicted membrane chloride channel (bestrophin family)
MKAYIAFLFFTIVAFINANIEEVEENFEDPVFYDVSEFPLDENNRLIENYLLYPDTPQCLEVYSAER